MSKAHINTSRTSLTADPYLLRATPPTLHRVDTRLMAAPCHMVAGRTDEPSPHPADDHQGRGLDHLQRKHTVSARAARWLRRLQARLLGHR